MRPDLDALIRQTVGEGQYSAFINDAALLALQARGIADWVAEFEREHGAITPDELAAAKARLSAAAKKAKR